MKLKRREFLSRLASGVGPLAVASSYQERLAHAGPAYLRHFGSARKIIWIVLNGGLSQVDSFDPKPALRRFAGQALPASLQLPTGRKTGFLLPSPFSFSRSPRCGTEFSEIFPNIGNVLDEFCVIRSMTSPYFQHEAALPWLCKGSLNLGAPSVGAKLLHGLESLNKDLPGYMVLSPNGLPLVGPALWSSGRLPNHTQGQLVSLPSGAPNAVPFADLIPSSSSTSSTLEFTQRLDRSRWRARGQSKEDPILDHITNLETAFRMQSAAPEAFDLQMESAEVRQKYGESTFAKSCLLARRLSERDVRCVQLFFSGGNPWDHHDDAGLHRLHARTADQPIAALVRDLRNRGLLAETLLLVTTEFGRTPMVEIGEGGKGGLRIAAGRSHNPHGFSTLVAGAGIRQGTVYGATDDFGFQAVESRCSVADLLATVFHLAGLNCDEELMGAGTGASGYQVGNVESPSVIEGVLA